MKNRNVSDHKGLGNDLPDVLTGRRSLNWLKSAHREQLVLCDQLEEIADSLPANINRQKCMYAAKALGPLIHGLHHYEENVLFPWIEKNMGKRRHMAETLTRLKFEHCEDECFAEELTDALLKLGAGDGNINAEATGYMLRGFFEAVRRHIAFEREFLLDDMLLLDQQADVTDLPPGTA